MARLGARVRTTVPKSGYWEWGGVAEGGAATSNSASGSTLPEPRDSSGQIWQCRTPAPAPSGPHLASVLLFVSSFLTSPTWLQSSHISADTLKGNKSRLSSFAQPVIGFIFFLVEKVICTYCRKP